MVSEQRHKTVLIGDAPEIKAIYQELMQVSQSRATVLLRGESGTGKELVAKLIHENSPRASGPFIKVNCAALSETLLESELFGHERGAFTGAIKTKKGRFDLADGGTLFLDEIGDLPLQVQVKLLQVLQERSFERVGGIETLTVDVRTVAATHRDLEKAIVSGAFREDLYYRLNVIPIFLPPLRKRREDIPLLVRHFLDKFNKENNKKVELSNAILELFTQYNWPGNVRELENAIERLTVLSREDRITLNTIPPAIKTYFSDIQRVVPSQGTVPLPEATEEIERDALKKALACAGGVQAKAARLLGITYRQIAYKMKRYGIAPNESA
ncbi:MAG: sigma 54-interacting transcriptional regulator [Nitrospirae bacterium]|nr:sigma 54-interacting transcriptional regulator [Candidatus Troglogloeales bacterium]MBI3598446.1 sigma 54-interacting transcriptional regulator [Candidatus Troglogloeales bacterium]